MKVNNEELQEALKLNEALAARRGRNLAPDLIGVGHETIVHCLKKFDPSKGAKFTAFIYPYLQRDHRRAFIDQIVGTHVPHDIADYDKHTAGMSRYEIDSEEGWEHPLQPKEATNTVKSDINEALSLLAPPLRELLKLRYFAGYSTREIAIRYSVSPSWISRRLRSAERSLRMVYDLELPPEVEEYKVDQHTQTKRRRRIRRSRATETPDQRKERIRRNTARSVEARQERRKAQLRKADLSGLPQYQQEIIAQYIEGKPAADIAKALGKKRIYVSTIVWRATKQGYRQRELV